MGQERATAVRRTEWRIPLWPDVATIASIFFAFMMAASVAGAQEAAVQVARGPHYVGEAIEIQVVAHGFEGEPTPEVVAGRVDGATLRYAGVSDSSSTSITIVNGRMTRVSEVSFVFRFELVPIAEGRVHIPPFRVTQGQHVRETRALDLRIEGVPSTGLVGLSLSLPEGPLFVGQKVTVDVELRIDREAQRDLLSYRAMVPLFELESLRFLDEPVAGADRQLDIQTSAGTMRLPATASEESVDGRATLVLRARRTMIALAPGEIQAAAPRVVIERGTRFRRDLFNQRQATASTRLLAEGDPVRLEVVEVPREGRPESFAGAVGDGFSLEVSADRSVVQLGEPILLAFTLRGNGDLSTASLPPLDADGLFDPEQFRLPEESPTGRVEDGAKRFEVSLRVLDANVTEIPALAYSWYDAKSRSFETTTSRPIALSVGAAEIIGADDVARNVDPSERDEVSRVSRTARNTDDAEKPEGEGPRSSSLRYSGADLAVETNRERVLRTPNAFAISPFVLAGLYLIGFALLVVAAIARRRRDEDPAVVERRNAVAKLSKGVESALGASSSAAAEQLGRVLRQWVADQPEEAGDEVDLLLAECDALRFSPDGAAGLPETLAERARQFVRERG